MVLLGLDPGQAVLLLVHEVAGQQKVSEVIHEKLELEAYLLGLRYAVSGKQ